MKIYLSGPWARRAEVRVMRDEVIELAPHHVFVSRWLDHVSTGGQDERKNEALNDVADLDDADVIIVANLEMSEGKSFEQGYMLKAGKPIIVIGDLATTPNVFHHHPAVKMVSNIHAALYVVENLDKLDALKVARSKHVRAYSIEDAPR